MSVNKVILLGHVGKAPEIREVNGTKVASFTMATTDKGYTKQDGTKVPDRTEWHNLSAWNKLAEIIERYITKGSQLYIEGSIHTRSYDKNGEKRYMTEINVDKIEMLGKPQSDAQKPAYQPPTPAPAPAPTPVFSAAPLPWEGNPV